MINNKIKNNSKFEIVNISSSDDIKFDINKLNSSTFTQTILYYDSISSSPIEYLLTGLLTCASGAIGKFAYFKITETMNIFLNVWAVIIGPSTLMRKTSAINLTKDDLQRIEAKNYSEFEKQKQIYENNLEEMKSSNQQKEVVKPLRKYVLLPNDTTIESLSDILAISDRGLLTHSEFGSFLQQLNRGYSGDAKQFFTAIYDIPQTWEVARATKENKLLLSPYLSILGASTIEWIKENSNDTDLRSGFFARFIFSIRNTPDKDFIPLLLLKDISRRSEYYLNTRDIYNRLISYPGSFELEITEEARELHINFDKKSYYELLESTTDYEMSFKGRLLIYSLKFAGIIALINDRTTVIKEDVEDAILITEYFKGNVERLLNKEMVSNDTIKKEEKILGIIKSKKGAIKRSDLSNLSNMKKRELDEVLDGLIDKEKIEAFEQQTEKRRAKYYRIIN